MISSEIEPAKRVERVEEYYFSQKLQEIRNMNKTGNPVINLGIGSPDLPPSPEVIEVLHQQSQLEQNHGYQPYAGIPELREAFANWYSRYYQVILDPISEILPLMGSKEGIMNISLAFLNPGDVVLVPNPGYPAYRSVGELVGAVVHEYPLIEDSQWMPDLGLLEKNLLKGTRVMWVNYPNMPTGQPGNKEFFTRLIEFARRNNILIINDNPYSFILNDKPYSLLSLPGAKGVIMELNSLSKSHNMAGWRMGMVAGKAEYIQYILRVKSNMDSGMFKPLQLAAVKALQAGTEWYEKQNRIYRERREKIWEIFDLLKCTYDLGQTGMFVWAKVPATAGAGKDIAEEILQKSRVFITPGFIFGTGGMQYLRASLCQPVDIIVKAKKRILDQLGNFETPAQHILYL